MSKKAFHAAHARQALARCALVAVVAGALAACETSRVTSTVQPGTGGATLPRSSADSRRAAQTRVDLAAEYLRHGRNDVAIEEANNALGFSAGMVEAYMVRGMAYAQKGDYASAEADFARVMRSRGNDPDVMHNYAGLLCQLRRFDDAISYYDRVLAMPGQAGSVRTLTAKGLCLQGAGRVQAAINTLEQAYKSDPRNPVAAYNLASMYYHAGQVAQAQTYLQPLNNSNLANAETLWLGIKVANAMGNQLRLRELGGVLVRNFPQSREAALYERGAFYE